MEEFSPFTPISKKRAIITMIVVPFTIIICFAIVAIVWVWNFYFHENDPRTAILGTVIITIVVIVSIICFSLVYMRNYLIVNHGIDGIGTFQKKYLARFSNRFRVYFTFQNEQGIAHKICKPSRWVPLDGGWIEREFAESIEEMKVFPIKIL